MAFCKVCYKSIVLSNMGKRALDSHSKSKKHTEALKMPKFTGLTNFMKVESKESNKSTDNLTRPKTETLGVAIKQSENTLDPAADQSEETLDIPPPPDDASTVDNDNNVTAVEGPKPAPIISKWLQSKESRKAEIIWTLSCVQDHYSFRSSENKSELFRKMFWDSNIAQQYSLGKTKQSYLLTFGLAPYFKDLLVDTLKLSSFFTVIFDEAFNDVLQKEQMDILVRFWSADRVVTRYLGSEFLNGGKAEDLLSALKNGLSEFKTDQILQLGMDGPNVNLKVHRLYVEDRKKLDKEMPDLIDIGTCSLHVIHGALQTGMKKSGWEIERVLKCLWRLFHDTYVRRTSYTDITNSTVFPLKFCATRWVEDEPVASRALKIWPNIVKYVLVTLKKKKSEIPTCTSFDVVREAVADKLMVAKLEFFIFIAKKLKPILTKYQDDKPLAIYLGKDIAELLDDLMELFVKEDVLDQNRTGYKLAALDVENNENIIAAKSINIGNGARQAIQSIKISELQKLEFRSSCRQALCATVAKIQERCPLKYAFLRAFRSLDPDFIASRSSAVTTFRAITAKLVASKRFTVAICDEAEGQYKKLARDEKEQLVKFDPKTERLDEFYHAMLNNKQEFTELWKVVQLILVISHGQAQVERSFSVNDDILSTNMKTQTLCAIKLVHDTLKSQDVKVHQYEVPDKMLQYCSQARNKYSQYLISSQAEKKKEAEKRKNTDDEEKYQEAKKKMKMLEDEASSCLNEADKKAKDSLKKHDFNLLAQSVALREKGQDILKKQVSKQSEIVKQLKNKIN